jgi:hypothetical protein
MKKGQRKPILYLGPVGQMREHLDRLQKHRRHVAVELQRVERLLVKHPELRKLYQIPASFGQDCRARLVVNNASSSIKQFHRSPTEPAGAA